MFRIVEGNVKLVDSDGNTIASFESEGETYLKVYSVDDPDNPKHVAIMARDKNSVAHESKDISSIGAENDELSVRDLKTQQLLEELVDYTKRMYLILSMIIGDEIRSIDTKDL